MRSIDELILLTSQPILSLQDFFAISKECLSSLQINLDMMPVINAQYEHYILPFVPAQNIYLRPINRNIFIYDHQKLSLCQRQLYNLIAYLSKTRGDLTSLPQELKQFADDGLVIRTIYTTLQAIGCILDKSINIQGARKNFGQRFEEFVKAILTELGIPNGSFTFMKQIPGINITYRVPLDVIINPADSIHSNRSYIDQRDTILSIKTSSKDRMKFIFVDRFALKSILNVEYINHIAIYHNDIQRSGNNRINSTFVPDVYLVFCHIFGDLPLYYIDPPTAANDSRFSGKIKTFDTFMLYDLWKL